MRVGLMIPLIVPCTESGCSFTTKNGTQMLKHRLQVHKIPPYRCYVAGCERKFAKRDRLTAHHRTEHSPTDEWTCPECSETFPRYQLVTKHIREQHPSRRIQCAFEGCNYSATTRSKIAAHQEEEHSPKPFLCRVAGCNEGFDLDFFRLQHEATHQTIKPFCCSVEDCDFASAYRANVAKHIRKDHWKLTLREQKRDKRDPNEYIVVDEELMTRRKERIKVEEDCNENDEDTE